MIPDNFLVYVYLFYLLADNILFIIILDLILNRKRKVKGGVNDN